MHAIARAMLVGFERVTLGGPERIGFTHVLVDSHPSNVTTQVAQRVEHCGAVGTEGAIDRGELLYQSHLAGETVVKALESE